ncbi:hypothetical protein J3E68DRAFT_416956 [Trichoderma sp. SZMC 28012]
MYTASFTNPAFHTPCVAPTAQGLAHPAPFFPRRGGKRERARANKPKWPGPLFLFSSSPFPFFPIVRCSQLVCARYLVVEPSWGGDQKELFERARVSPEIAVCEWARGRAFLAVFSFVTLHGGTFV